MRGSVKEDFIYVSRRSLNTATRVRAPFGPIQPVLKTL